MGVAQASLRRQDLKKDLKGRKLTKKTHEGGIFKAEEIVSTKATEQELGWPVQGIRRLHRPQHARKERNSG